VTATTVIYSLSLHDALPISTHLTNNFVDILYIDHLFATALNLLRKHLRNTVLNILKNLLAVRCFSKVSLDLDHIRPEYFVSILLYVEDYAIYINNYRSVHGYI